MQEGECVKTTSRTNHSVRVPIGAKHAETVRARRSWAESTVWTERMLTALDKGVKGGRWYSLIDKVYDEENLRSAFAKVKANKGGSGVDHVTIERFESRIEEELQRLHESLRDGTYRPQAIKRSWIDKPGTKEKRPLGIPTVRDRVVQTALRNVLEPIFERDFAEHSYGFRPGRSAKDALRRVDRLIREGYVYVVDADLKSYFDSIPQDRLMKLVRAKIADGRVLQMIEAYLSQPIMEGLQSHTPESGTPQGAVISPLLSNIYLDTLDHQMSEAGYEMTRYADDFVIQCRTRREAEEALAQVQAWAESNGLRLHPDKTHIVDVREEGFDFLGYRFYRRGRWPRKKSLKKFKDSVRERTRRTNGHSMATIIAKVNCVLRGWYNYFKHVERWVFEMLDKWIRMRLRSILRKRRGGRGRGRGRDHQRWPNSYFAERGLFSLLAAYESERRQSSLR